MVQEQLHPDTLQEYPESSSVDLTPSKYAPKGISIEQITTLKLRNPNLTLRQAAAILDCDQSNITRRLQGANLSWDGLKQELTDYKANRADLLALKGKSALESITHDKLQKAAPSQAAAVFGILYDKERLERGQSTENVSYADMTMQSREIERQIKELRKELGESDE